MANKPISDNTAFPFETNVRAIAGIAGFQTGTPNTNAKIGGIDLVQSVINGGSANAGGLAVYATSGSVKELATYISLNYTAGDTTAPAVLELGTPSHPSTVQISGNFNGPDPFVSPKLTFLTKNTTTGSNTVSIEPSSVATADQSLVLPPAPGTAGQGLKAASVSSGDVLLEWYTVTDDDTTYTFDSTQSLVGSDADPFLTLTGSDTTTDNVKLIGGTSIGISRNTTGDEVTIAYTGTDSDTTYTLGTALSGALGQIDLTPSSGTTDSVQLQGAGTVSVSSNAAGLITITGTGGGSLAIEDEGTQLTAAADKINFTGAGVTASAVSNDVTVNIPGGGGGASAFTTITTDSATGDAEWDYANDGPNIEFTPEFPNGAFWNLIKLKNNVMPADGDHGYLILNPSITQTFQLPSNSLILNGDVLPGGTNTVTYEWVYDGTNFHWEKQPNQITPIYAPFNPFPTTNLIGVFDPDTINPAIIQFGNPYDDDVVPDDSGSTTDITVNYAVPNGGVWTNSLSSGNILGSLTANSNPFGTGSQYKPSFVVNYAGGIALATYDSTTTPEVIVPNPDLASTTNSQSFYFQDFTPNGTAGSYTTVPGDVLTIVGGVESGEKAGFELTSDGTDITSIEVTTTGKGYSLGDLIQIDMASSGLGTGEIYVLVNDKEMLGGTGPGSKRATAVQIGYPDPSDVGFAHPGFGSASNNDLYRFTVANTSTPVSANVTVVMWLHGQYPSSGSYNTLFDFTNTPSSSNYDEAMYFNGTNGTFEPDSSGGGSFTDLPQLGDYSGGGGSAINFNNEWTFISFTFIPAGSVSQIIALMRNQSTTNNAGNAAWDYGGSRNVAVDADGWCGQTINFGTLDTTWTQFSLGNSYYISSGTPAIEGWRSKVGKFAIYSSTISEANIKAIYDNTKGYYGITN